MATEQEMTELGDASRESIVSVYTRLLQAWNRQDSEAFAALFTATGSIVGFDGSQMNGRGEIASGLRAVFANHPTAAYTAKVREVRWFSSQTALLRAVVGMIPPGKTDLNPAVNTVQSVLLVFESGEIKIGLLHNTPAAFHGRPHLGEELTQELSEVVRAGRVVEAG